MQRISYGCTKSFRRITTGSGLYWIVWIKLRHLKIMQEGIQLPTIVVVGDQSSGKSSVLESLAGISLSERAGHIKWIKQGREHLRLLQRRIDHRKALLEKVTADDVHIGLGYVCVRNRIGEESYEEARMEEAKLFQSHSFLSKIDKSMVSIPCTGAEIADLNRLPQNLSTVAEALKAFMRITSSAKESLRKILVRGEFDEYPDEKEMHCTAREILALEEAKEIGLPNFLPRRVFFSVLQKRVKVISTRPQDFVAKLWDYIEKKLWLQFLMQHADSYPQLQCSMRRASQNLIAKMKQKSVDWVVEIIGMEMMADYSCNPEYSATWNKLMEKQGEFMEILNDISKGSKFNVDGIEIEIGHLRGYVDVVSQAFDMRMRIIAYWKIVLMRLVDSMALHVLYSIQKLVNTELEDEVVADLMAPHGGGIERMLEESPIVAEKRYRLTKSVKLLRESKDVVASIMDRIGLARV
nr:dynamin-related protein 4C-like [Ipomoea batatas]